jgi:nucleotide-binding universal stress UspA family protein
MKKIVVPIGDARDTRWAVAQVLDQHRKEPVEVHLLTVRHPLPLHVSQFFKNDGGLHDFYQEAGMVVLKPAIKALDAAGIPHTDHVLVGHKVETIVAFAKRNECEIVIENRPSTLFSMFGLGSVASQVERLMQAHA